jgi:hypothetical protein
MKSATPQARAKRELQLTVAARDALRKAEVTQQAAQRAKANLKTARKAFKLAKKTARRAAKKAVKREKELVTFRKAHRKSGTTKNPTRPVK